MITDDDRIEIEVLTDSRSHRYFLGLVFLASCHNRTGDKKVEGIISYVNYLETAAGR